MAIQIIPLNKLQLSAHNVRKTGAENQLDELVANIAANGILQNLIGGPAKKKGFTDIFAGGRRLRALNRLAAEGKIEKDHGVPVLLVEQSEAGVAETSLSENFVRLNMTPTDECKAFLHFLGTEGDVEAVAKRFGLTRRFVEGRLRLATLADPIFDALAGGEMTMEVAKAYAATPDQAKQLAVFEEVGNSWLATNALEIRKRILGSSISASHPIALLIGEKHYSEAGGRISRDLFTEAESAEWLDGDLATTLASAIMQEAAATHAEQSGIGTIIPLLAKGSNWTDREDLAQARLERAPLSETAEARLAEIAEEHAQIEEHCESTELDEDEIDTINGRVEALEREEADLRNTELLIDAERKASLTQFLVIGPDGTPVIEPAYWEEPRRHTASGGHGNDSHQTPKGQAKSKGLSGVLVDELAMARRDVLALHVASDPSIALDLAIFSLAERSVGHYSEIGCALTISRLNDPIVRNGVPDNAAAGALHEIRQQLDTSWSEFPSAAERFDAFRALNEEDRASWLAVCMAKAIEASIGGKGLSRHNGFHDHLGQLLEIDVAAWWRPTASTYFSRVRKGGMQKALNEIGGPVLAARYASSKSAEMADACEKICSGAALVEPEIREAGIAWLPTAMQFNAIATADTEAAESENADDELGEAVHGDGDGDDADGDLNEPESYTAQDEDQDLLADQAA